MAQDAAIAGALRGTEGLEQRSLTFDVVCITIRHILERFQEKYPELAPLIENMQMLLPSMHIHAHKELCQFVYATALAEGFGLIHGEGVETPWAEMNAVGLSTREMSAGSRHDMLNGQFNYWNWMKDVGIGEYGSINRFHCVFSYISQNSDSLMTSSMPIHFRGAMLALLRV